MRPENVSVGGRCPHGIRPPDCIDCHGQWLSPRDAYTLRSLLWSSHCTPGDGHYLYGDDGELQCTAGVDGACDFRRATVDEIRRHVERRGLRLLAEAADRLGWTVGEPSSGRHPLDDRDEYVHELPSQRAAECVRCARGEPRYCHADKPNEPYHYVAWPGNELVACTRKP